MASKYSEFKLVKVDDLGDFVYKVSLNRPEKLNALNMEIWMEIGKVFQIIDEDPDCRCVILTGEGKHFCVGLDLSGGVDTTVLTDDSVDVARRARNLYRKIKIMQKQFTYIQECSRPVLLTMHGYCLGGAIDIATACDIRFATNDTILSVKEVDIGMAADVGTLNRLPKVVGNKSWIKDVCLTGRHFSSQEALQNGLVSRLFATRHEMMSEAERTARLIATKSPVGVQGTKLVLDYANDNSVENSLNYVATWNMSQLLTADMMSSAMATMMKEKLPPFSKL